MKHDILKRFLKVFIFGAL